MPGIFAEVSQAIASLLLVISHGDFAFAPALWLVEDGQETNRSGAFGYVTADALLHTAAVTVRWSSTVNWNINSKSIMIEMIWIDLLGWKLSQVVFCNVS